MSGAYFFTGFTGAMLLLAGVMLALFRALRVGDMVPAIVIVLVGVGIGQLVVAWKCLGKS